MQFDKTQGNWYNCNELETFINNAVQVAVSKVLPQLVNLDNGIEKNDDEPSCTPEKITLSVEETA